MLDNPVNENLTPIRNPEHFEQAQVLSAMLLEITIAEKTGAWTEELVNIRKHLANEMWQKHEDGEIIGIDGNWDAVLLPEGVILADRSYYDGDTLIHKTGVVIEWRGDQTYQIPKCVEITEPHKDGEDLAPEQADMRQHEMNMDYIRKHRHYDDPSIIDPTLQDPEHSSGDYEG